MNLVKRKILRLVRRTLTPEQIERSLIYWHKRVLQKGDFIQAGPQTVAMPFEGTMVFVDLAPRANWAHPCLYMLVDNDARNAEVIEASIPPNIDETDESYIIILRYGQKPPHEHYFSAFDN